MEPIAGELQPQPSSLVEQVVQHRRNLFDLNIPAGDPRVARAIEKTKHSLSILQTEKGLEPLEVVAEVRIYVEDILKDKGQTISTKVADTEVVSGLVGRNIENRKKLVNTVITKHTSVDSAANLMAANLQASAAEKQRRASDLSDAAREVIGTGVEGMALLLQDKDYRDYREAKRRISSGGSLAAVADLELVASLIQSGKEAQFNRLGVVFDTLGVDPIAIIDDVLDAKKGNARPAVPNRAQAVGAVQTPLPQRLAPQVPNTLSQTAPTDAERRAELLDNPDRLMSHVNQLLLKIESEPITIVRHNTSDAEMSDRETLKALNSLSTEVRAKILHLRSSSSSPEVLSKIDSLEAILLESDARQRLHDSVMVITNAQRSQAGPETYLGTAYSNEQQLKYAFRVEQDIQILLKSKNFDLDSAFLVLQEACVSGKIPYEALYENQSTLTGRYQSIYLPLVAKLEQGGFSHEKARMSIEIARRLAVTTMENAHWYKDRSASIISSVVNFQTYRQEKDLGPLGNFTMIPTLGVSSALRSSMQKYENNSSANSTYKVELPKKRYILEFAKGQNARETALLRDTGVNKNGQFQGIRLSDTDWSLVEESAWVTQIVKIPKVLALRNELLKTNRKAEEINLPEYFNTLATLIDDVVPVHDPYGIRALFALGVYTDSAVSYADIGIAKPDWASGGAIPQFDGLLLQSMGKHDMSTLTQDEFNWYRNIRHDVRAAIGDYHKKVKEAKKRGQLAPRFVLPNIGYPPQRSTK
jgi:hypothetical protein